MSDKHLHIICLDVPYPADYGGAIEMYCKIKTLHKLGIKIHLHCFEYGRGRQPELNKYCEEVFYYTRSQRISSGIPYIVSSRASDDLIKRLQQDHYPVLLEGIHCSYPVYINALPGRKVVMRMHNIEHEYYRNLSKLEKNLFKKIYLLNEGRLLRRYESEIAGKGLHLAITKHDESSFRAQTNQKNIAYLPPFIPYDSISSKEGIGNFCLYHGNLSVAENEKAALWLLNEVFSKIETPLVIAGKNPSDKLDTAAHKKLHTCLVANPSEIELQDLISKAQINIIPSFNKAGIKFKLLNALFNGRHCLVNEEAVNGTGLEPACHIASNSEAFASVILQLFHKSFTGEEIHLRKQLLQQEFNNQTNAQRLIAWLW